MDSSSRFPGRFPAGVKNRPQNTPQLSNCPTLIEPSNHSLKEINMALPEIRGTGRLLTDPRTGTTKTDKPWTSALVKFATWRKTDTGWEEGDGTVASAVAFDDNATQLARYGKGDPIGIHGTTKAAVWRDKPQLAVTIMSCWTPEEPPGQNARPRTQGRERKAENARPRTQRAGTYVRIPTAQSCS